LTGSAKALRFHATHLSESDALPTKTLPDLLAARPELEVAGIRVAESIDELVLAVVDPAI
jgi:hypothetical protein